MRKLMMATAIVAVLAGCSREGGFMGFGGSTAEGDGGSYGVTRTTPERGAPGAPGYAGETTGEVYRGAGYTYRLEPHNDRFWPPVIQGQAIPAQEMWAE